MSKPTLLIVDSSSEYPHNPLFAEVAAQSSGVRRADVIDEAKLPAFGRRWRSSRIGRGAEHITAAVALNGSLRRQVDELRPDVLLVVKGARLTARSIDYARRRGVTTVNFSTDDPFRQLRGNALWRRSLASYDLLLTPRLANASQLASLGPAVRQLRFGYHRWMVGPEPIPSMPMYAADLAFIGGADADRVPFVQRLSTALPRLRLALYGAHWSQVPELRRFAQGSVHGASYRAAVREATISLNLVRRANRDDHVMRTFEVPACGGLLISDRTTTHRELFAHCGETLFSDADEAIALIEALQKDEALAKSTAQRQHVAVVGGANTYGDRLDEVLRILSE